jgi:hypothetical protein
MRWKIHMRCWESVASTVAGAIISVHLVPKAGISWRMLSVKDRAWKDFAAGDADQKFSILILAVRGV